MVTVEKLNRPMQRGSAVVRVGSDAAEVALTEALSPPQSKPTISDAEFVNLLPRAVAKLGR